MPKKKPLFKTYTVQDDRRLKQLVADFNRKRSVMQKELGNQPPKLKYSELAKTIGSRGEYNRVLNVYGRYLRPGAEKIHTNESGIHFTRWERDENRYAIMRINNRRAKRLQELQIKFNPQEMGRMEDLNLKPARNWTDSYTDSSNFNKYFKSLQHQANVDYWKRGAETYKRNYLKALKDEFKGTPGYAKLRSMLSKLTPEEMLESTSLHYSVQLHFVYGFEDKQMRLDKITETWKMVYKQKYGDKTFKATGKVKKKTDFHVNKKPKKKKRK